MERASISTFDQEGEEEQDTGRDLLGNPKRKDVEHVPLMDTSVYLPALWILPCPFLPLTLSNAAGYSHLGLVPDTQTQKGVEGPKG